MNSALELPFQQNENNIGKIKQEIKALDRELANVWAQREDYDSRMIASCINIDPIPNGQRQKDVSSYRDECWEYKYRLRELQRAVLELELAQLQDFEKRKAFVPSTLDGTSSEASKPVSEPHSGSERSSVKEKPEAAL